MTTEPKRKYLIAIAVVLSAISLAPIWATELFPSQNGPWYLLLVQMFKEYTTPEFGFNEYYTINWHPVPHMLHNTLVLCLSYFMPLLTAEKVALSASAIGLPLSVFYFLSRVAPKRILLGFLAYLLVHNYVFYRGYHNFYLSVPLFFVTFAFWYEHRDRLRPRHFLALSLLSCALYLAHLFSFVFLVCAVGYFRLLETKSLVKTVTSVLCATGPVWILFADYIMLVKQNAVWVDPSDTVFMRPHTSIENLFRKVFYTTSSRAYVVGSIPWIWLIALFVIECWSVVKGHGREMLHRLADRPLLIVLLTVTLGYLFVPAQVAGWHHVNVRLIPFIFGLTIACSSGLDRFGTREKALSMGFLATVFVCTVLQCLFVTADVRRMTKDVEEYASGIPHYDGKSPLFPIHASNDAYGQIRPVTRAHEYYHISKGGANGNGIAFANTHVSMWYREYPVTKMFPKYDADHPVKSLELIEDTYGYVLLWGHDPKWELMLEESRFHLIHNRGRLSLFRNEDLDQTTTSP